VILAIGNTIVKSGQKIVINGTYIEKEYISSVQNCVNVIQNGELADAIGLMVNHCVIMEIIQVVMAEG